MTYPRIVFPEPGRVLVEALDEVPEPGPGQLRVRALASLVSTGTESFALAGRFDPGTFWADWVRYPFEPGYSLCARVEAVGPGVDGFAAGDRVAVCAPHRGLGLADAAEAVLVPDAITDEQATWASLAATTQLGVRRGDPALGEVAVVVGLGLLGQLVVRYLRLRGLRRLVAVDSSAGRLELALSGGATDALAVPVGDAVDGLREATGGLADVAFDVTGAAAALAPTTELVRPGGRLVLLGDCPTPSRQTLGPRVLGDSLTLIGVHASSGREPWTYREMTGLFFDFLADGRMRVDDLVTHRIGPQEAPMLYERLRQDRSAYLAVMIGWPA